MNEVQHIKLYRLEELYPDNESPDQSKHCKHKSKPMSITQKYFVCEDNLDSSNNFRVTEQTYIDMTTLSSLKERYSCKTQPTQNEVCHCPAGYTGYLCDEPATTKCYVNITNPALYKGCTGKDSQAYVWSI